MSIKDEIVKISHLIYQNKFVAAYDGNISALSERNTIFITRSGVCKGELTIEDILEIDLKGNIISGEGKISTENKLHRFIYSKRSDVKAVVHCHPIYSTAFTLVGEGLIESYFPEVILHLGKVPLCKYATPSTDELIVSIKDYVENSSALLLQNHGAVTFGESVFDAYYKMEKLEHAAKTIFIARMLGNPRQLSEEEINKLISISESTYGIKIK
ncbi:MAG: class II aldolase/adducin family protein [Ignavibacterium sp.]|nr:class II aldolase/adducin family protein [Ignavibacterium sp.]